MKKLALFLLVFLGLAFSAPRVLTQDQPASTTDKRLLLDLPDFQAHSNIYKVDPYIRDAIALEASGKKRDSERLFTIAYEREERANAVFILCRMLFTKRKVTTFRPPMLGGAAFIGPEQPGFTNDAESGYAGWPFEPIELVDGIPFLVVRGYNLLGFPEPAADYLNYCIQNCDWNPFPFKPKSNHEKQAALQKLIASPKWKTPLDSYERAFLSSQIK